MQEIVHRWFEDRPSAERLLDLIQAEQGIAACTAGRASALQLHTTTLTRGLDVDELGGSLLANELEWAGLLPAPHEGLAGEYFSTRPVREYARGDAAE